MDDTPWRIREADLDDAEGVRRCFEDAFRRYVDPGFTSSHRIRSYLDDPDAHVYVAEMAEGGEEGAIAGTAAVLYDADHRRAEISRAAIRNDYRQEASRTDSMFADLARHLFDDVNGHEPAMTYAHSVTSHSKGQYMLERFGMVPTAFERQKLHPVLTDERESGMFYVGRTDIDRPHRLYAPDARLREVAEHTLDRLDRAYGVGAADGAGEGLSMVEAALCEDADHRVFTVTPDGPLRPEDVYERVAAARDEHAYTEVQAAANSPSTAAVAEELLEEGFDPAGFIPTWMDAHDTAYDAFLLSDGPAETHPVRVTMNGAQLLSDLGFTAPEELEDGLQELTV